MHIYTPSTIKTMNSSQNFCKYCDMQESKEIFNSYQKMQSDRFFIYRTILCFTSEWLSIRC